MRKLKTVLITLLFMSMLGAGLLTIEAKAVPGPAMMNRTVQEASASQPGAEQSTKSETGHSSKAKTEEHQGEEADKEEHGGAGEENGAHEGAPPFMYFVQWIMLIAAFILGLLYLRKVRTEGKPRHEGTGLAYALIVLVLLFFALGYYPGVADYHESGLVSLFKFLLLLLTGILVTYYGVLGRHEEH